jgi:DegV family protein with EDD domain
MPTEYLLVTDSCCDLPRATVDELDVGVLEFPFTLDGSEHFDDLGQTVCAADFYGAMRVGSTPTTAQVPMASYLECFSAAAEKGVPLLFLSFSSALSGTFDSAVLAGREVCERYPDARISIVDTRSASAAQGLLVLGAARRRREGMGFSELTEWVDANLQRVNGFFTIDTLEALRRGGRVSDLAAFAGSVLDVKPLLRIDRRGQLVIDRPVRGRKKSIRALVEAYEARVDPDGQETVLVAHGDASDDVALLEQLLAERAGVTDVMRLDVGPVIGSHTGPGMVAVVFWGQERAS